MDTSIVTKATAWVFSVKLIAERLQRHDCGSAATM